METKPRKQTPVGGAPPQPQYEIITPELAAKWLDDNLGEDHNRPLRAERAAGFARDMETGNWHDNGETVKFDWNGRLVDGQHRLAAIVKAGLPMSMLVVRGVAPDSIHTIDMGVARRYSDVLKMNGVRNPATMAALERRLYLWHKHGIKAGKGSARGRTPTVAEMQAFRANYEQLLGYALDRALDVKKKVPKVSAATYGTAYILFAEIDAPAADKFFDLLMTGAGLTHRDPVLVLRDRLQDANGQFVARRTGEDEKLALIIRAWNIWRAGDKVSQILINPHGKPLTDETFPEPK
jgi:hypothetical protein